MTTQESIGLFKNYLQSNHVQRTIDSYVYLHLAKSTRRLRYSQPKTFYNLRASSNYGRDLHFRVVMFVDLNLPLTHEIVIPILPFINRQTQIVAGIRGIEYY